MKINASNLLYLSSLLASLYSAVYWLLLFTNSMGVFWFLQFMDIDFSAELVLGLVILSLIFAFLAALGTGRVYYRLGRKLHSLHRYALIVFWLVSLLVGWFLFPVACDTHESFLDIPNKKCDCAGIEFKYYLMGAFDAPEIDFCIGREFYNLE